MGHAAVAVLVGLAALQLRKAQSIASVSRSAGTRRVLTSPRTYSVAAGAAAAGMLQVGLMVMLPTLLAEGHGYTTQQSALVIVAAMLANWIGAMIVVTTGVRNAPAIALPVSAAIAAFFGFAIVSGMADDLSTKVTCVMLLAASVGMANSLVWSLLPAAVPSPEAGGATAGLITQGSFIGVFLSPPVFFWIRHEGPLPMALLALVLTILMVVPLVAHAHARREIGGAMRPVSSH
jgi:hypothetical protein